jgi:ABC-type transport system substrate-binding protein
MGDLMSFFDIDNSTSDGNLTVTIKFISPYGPGLFEGEYYLYDKAWALERGWDSQDWYDKPNGTGPYAVTEYVADDHMVLEPKDNYWNAANETFDVDKWIIKFYPDPGTLDMALETGEVDLGGVVNTSDYARWVKEGSDDVGMYVINQGSVNTLSLGFANTAVFDDINVRKAIAYGVDWAGIGEMSLGDLYIPATSCLTADSPYYTNVGSYPYDPEQAKQILADAGYKEGDIKISMYDMSIESRKQVDEAFQFYCQQIGIDVELEFGDTTSALNNWLSPGGTDAAWFSNATGANSRDPKNALLSWPDGGFTYRVITDPVLYGLLTDGLHTVDQEKRKEIYDEVQHYVFDNFIAFPAFEFVGVVGYRLDAFTEQEITENTLTNAWITLHGLSLADPLSDKKSR